MKTKPPALFTIQDLKLNYLHITHDAGQHEYACARILGVEHSEIYWGCVRAPKIGEMADKLSGIGIKGGVKIYTNCVYWEEL